MFLRRLSDTRTLLITAVIAFSIFVWTLHSQRNVKILNVNSKKLDYLPFIETHFEPSHLRRLCDETIWTDGLWVSCHSKARLDSEGKKSVHGGLNNVRNRIQTCLRVAIDAGAGVVIPMIARRDSKNLKALGTGEPVSADLFWNMEYMIRELEKECPRLQVRFDLKGIETKLQAPLRHYRDPRYELNSFRKMSIDLLKRSHVKFMDITPETPVAIIFGDSFLAWDYEKSLELTTIRQGLFKTLIYNQTLLDISSQILHSSKLKKGFIGIHLRAERDWPWSMGRPSDQMRLYTEEMNGIQRSSHEDHRTVFISCGNESSIQAFRKMIEPLGYKVHDKLSILHASPDMLATVDGLMFDEKAIVEYQILLNADLFLGLATSTMSALVAYARGLASNESEAFFPTHIYPGSTKDIGKDGLGLRRNYPSVPVMKGDSRSKLMVVNGDDVMSFFP